MKYLPVSERQPYQRTSTNLQQNSNREAHPRAGAEPPQGRQRPSPGSFGAPSLPPSPAADLLPVSRATGTAMTVTTTATPRSPSSHFRMVCKEKSRQAAAAQGPRPVPPAPSRGCPGPPSPGLTFMVRWSSAVRRRAGPRRLFWAQGARRGEGR